MWPSTLKTLRDSLPPPAATFIQTHNNSWCAAWQGLCEVSEAGTFRTPSGKTFSQAEALGFEATSASVTWLRGLGLFPLKDAEADDDDFIPEW